MSDEIATRQGTSHVVLARGVVKRYGRTVALAGLEAEIGAGITGLLGSNGAGKTTFLSLILGLRSRDEGQLLVLGEDPASSGLPIRARIGYAPEHHDLPSELPAADFVRHLAEVHLLPRRAAVQRANDALWLVGLGEERFRSVGAMSTGQRQRVKLAAAIAHDPELVLLDEPTDGLDPVQRTEMLDLIRRVGTEFGMHIVISSHHLEEVERICDAVVIVEGELWPTRGRSPTSAAAPRASWSRWTSGPTSLFSSSASEGTTSRSRTASSSSRAATATTTPCATPSPISASG